MATTPSNFASCGHVGQEILDGSSLKGDRLFVASRGGDVVSTMGMGMDKG